MTAKASGLNNNNSSYIQLANNILETFKLEQNTYPSEVAKVILQVVMADSPDFRSVVGKDAAMMLEARRSLSDSEFQDLLKKQFNLHNIS
jgi:hypothetical protein